ncbi:hypothetical protein [Bacillus solitudinis]|uniref:hypothetical protein n=1 Tax=Bacillus solitudinis TaxID=2014074 RepID=UPI000C2426E3|nr:hypothetical protein [Bacillus solitudinis]
MILLILLLPIMALLSMYAFRCAQWTTQNYERQQIPYSLGVLVVFAYAVLCAFPPILSPAFSYGAMGYVFGIWLIGFLDDRFGQVYPKGLKGHFYYVFNEKKLTTGILKVVGTILIAILFILYYQPNSVVDGVRCFLLLTWMPHVANLFDTRPLRVWKMSLLFLIVLTLIVGLPSFLTLIYVLVVFYLLFVLEGHRKAMLGDNGATTIGAIFAVLMFFETTVTFQWIIVFVVFMLMIIAERVSFSALIEKRSILRWFDQIGVPTRK